jgi:hypothetical protein
MNVRTRQLNDINTLQTNSNQILNDTVRWLLYSGIRIKNGSNRGAVYGWKNLKPPSYPFIYSEITGYAITSYVFIYSELLNYEALSAAKDCAYWLIQNIFNNKPSTTSLLPAGIIEAPNFNQKGDLSNQIYAFDNGMVIIGLLNLYKVTKDQNFLKAAEKIAKSLVDVFFDGSKLVAVLDREYNTISSDSFKDNHGIKWSSVSGPYHSKLSLCLLELSSLTNNNYCADISDSICKFALKFQRSDGRFVTNPDQENVTFLHPHLYACEGLVYAGIRCSNDDYLLSGIKGIVWAMNQMNLSTGGLPRNTAVGAPEQSDCMAQLLRLLIICELHIQEFLKSSEPVCNAIEELYRRLADFYIDEGNDKGGIRYQNGLDTACSWSTMFTMQALRIRAKRLKNKNKKWIDNYI